MLFAFHYNMLHQTSQKGFVKKKIFYKLFYIKQIILFLITLRKMAKRQKLLKDVRYSFLFEPFVQSAKPKN